jgi:hypothetical protein
VSVLTDALAPALTRVRVRADAGVSPPCNFKKDATERPSYGRPRGHRPIVRPSENVHVTTKHCTEFYHWDSIKKKLHIEGLLCGMKANKYDANWF